LRYNAAIPAARFPFRKRIFSMQTIIVLLGVVLLIVAGVYFLLPADQLPAFFPGHEAGMTHVHTKHGIAAGVAGIVLLATGWWLGRN
jgi:hypothetical protein